MTFKIGDIVVLRSGGRGIIMSLADFTEAHDRLAAAMRNATRGQADTAVAWDGELDAAELALMDDITEERDHLLARPRKPRTHIPAEWKNPHSTLYRPAVDSLVSKGCIELGQVATGVLWPGKQSVGWTVDPDRFAVRATERGLAKLRDAPTRKTPQKNEGIPPGLRHLPWDDRGHCGDPPPADVAAPVDPAAILQEFRAIQVMAVYTGDKETAAVIAWAIRQIESDPAQAAWFVDKSMDDIKAKMGEAK